MANFGFLAIWTDIPSEHFVEYRRWLSREHMGQRIFAPGFLGARVHVAADNELSHFILYATEHGQVLQSESYLDVLNNPTPWTRRMMPRLGGFDRGAGEQIAKVGDGCGAWLSVSRISSYAKSDAHSIEQLLHQPFNHEGIVTSRLFAVDRPATDVATTEKTMRGGMEGAFQSLLITEATSEAPLVAFEGDLPRLLQQLAGEKTDYDVKRYRAVYSLYPFEHMTASVDALPRSN